MIEVKVLEIRDSGTYIGALAIRMASSDPIQASYLRRDGYSRDGSTIVLVRMADAMAANDPYDWPGRSRGTRTMQLAHIYVQQHYPELIDGDVIDVEHEFWEELGLPSQPAKKTPDGSNAG